MNPKTGQRLKGDLDTPLLAHAQRQNDTSLFLSGHQALGTSAFFMGALTEAQDHFQQGFALYDVQRHHTLTFRHTQDPGLKCLSYVAWNLWLLGFPNQALQRIDEALTLAHDLSHPFSLARALLFVAFIMQMRREAQGAQERAVAAMTVSTGHGFVQWQLAATMIRGWTVATQGHREEGLGQLHHSLVSWQATDSAVALTYFLSLLADIYHTGGQANEGLSTVAEALALVDKNGERFWEAEIHRLKGQLLLQQSPDNHTEAESCFHQALSIARSQQAKSLELRAATSLARLWRSQGKRDEARELLEPVYGWFTEGFDTADLIEAKALLDELA